MASRIWMKATPISFASSRYWNKTSSVAVSLVMQMHRFGRIPFSRKVRIPSTAMSKAFGLPLNRLCLFGS